MSSAISRVADLMVLVVSSDFDVKTIAGWASHVGVSVGALRGYCHVVGVRPKAALDFARLLRLVLNAGDQWTPWVWLDVSDERNMRRLLQRGGLHVHGQPPRVDRFLQTQELLDGQAHLVHEVAERAASRARANPFQVGSAATELSVGISSVVCEGDGGPSPSHMGTGQFSGRPGGPS